MMVLAVLDNGVDGARVMVPAARVMVLTMRDNSVDGARMIVRAVRG
ncbi:MAG: hypothetical protein H7345_03570 [Rubritepida sp.]|nr:hypothetical protein [Rubritepida sp.]